MATNGSCTSNTTSNINQCIIIQYKILLNLSTFEGSFVQWLMQFSQVYQILIENFLLIIPSHHSFRHHKTNTDCVSCEVVANKPITLQCFAFVKCEHRLLVRGYFKYTSRSYQFFSAFHLQPESGIKIIYFQHYWIFSIITVNFL